MRSKQRSEKRRQRFSEGLPQVASKQQELFTTSTAPSQGTTRLEIVGQIHTDRACIKCNVQLTTLNLSPSQKTNHMWICKGCYAIHNAKGNRNTMYVNGKYVSRKHPLYKAGKYKGFEEAAFSSLENYADSAEGSVYVIANKAWDGWVKVGMAIDAEDRLKSYQTSSPFRDYVLYYSYTTSNRRKSEAEAHSMLEQKYERRNEWFLCTPSQAIEVLNG